MHRLPLRATLLALTLAACGGEKGSTTEPPPPPPPAPPPITRIELATTSALVFTGRTVSAKALVAKAYDSAGAVVPNPVLTLTAPQGWTVRGDTLIAPAVERRGMVRITATRPGAVSPRVAGLSLAGTASQGATDSVEVTAAFDLRAHQWEASWGCGYRSGQVMTDDPSRFIDSVYYDRVTVDSVVYAGEAGWVPAYGGKVGQIWYHGPVLRWLSDGAVDTVQAPPYFAVLDAQAPDTLAYAFATFGDAAGSGVRDTTAGAPLRYVGGTWCVRDDQRRGLVTLTERTEGP